jgi:putative RecB family exonuclease
LVLGDHVVVGQLSFEGMPRRLYACTPSRLRAWLDCPRRYRMTYLDRPLLPKGPPWAHNSLGASVHNALANWWRLPRAERTVPAVGALLDNGWIDEGYSGDAQSAACLSRSRAMVQDYVATLDPDTEPVGVERTVATKTELIAVSGRIDRLDDRGGELVVVDYKTGRHPPSADDARSSLALALYALAAGRVLRRECRKVELHHVPTGQIACWEHTQASLDRQLRRAEYIAGECAVADEQFGAAKEPGQGGRAAEREGDVFAPTAGAWCGWCDFRAHCPEGQLAAAQRRPWDGLAVLPPGDTVSSGVLSPGVTPDPMGGTPA